MPVSKHRTASNRRMTTAAAAALTVEPVSARPCLVCANTRHVRFREERGFAHAIIARERTLKFDEMEYHVPIEAGVPCFREVRARILARHRKEVAWRTLYRFVAGDEAYLSPTYGGLRVAISIHHHAQLPHDTFFGDIEPIFRAHGGRPHWGKKHSLKAAELAPLYPAFDDFKQLRRRIDPDGRYLNSHLCELLGEAS